MADPVEQGGKSIDNWLTAARDLWARLVAWWRS